MSLLPSCIVEGFAALEEEFLYFYYRGACYQRSLEGHKEFHKYHVQGIW